MTDGPLSDLGTTDAAPPASNWRPTATSVAVVLLGTGTLGGLLADATDLWNAVVPAAAGAVLLAVALTLAAAASYRPLARFVAACLLLPAGAGVVAGVGYALAKQLGGAYAVGSVFVVVGLAAAAFGAAAAVRDALTRDTLASALPVAAAVALPPTAAFVPLALVRVLEEFSATLFVPVLVPDPVPAAAFPAAVVDGVLRFLVAPTHEGPHLFSFALVCYAAVVGLASVLRAYPVADLLSPSDPDAAARVVAPLERAATLSATLGLLVVSAAGVLFVAPDGFAAVPPRVRDPLTALANVPVLRLVLLGGGLAGVLLGVGSWGLRRRWDAASDGLRASPSPPSLAAGVGVVAGAFVAHGAVLAALLDATLGVLPSTMAADVRTRADAVVAFYGGEVVLLGLCAGVLSVAAAATAFLYVSVRVGAVTDRAAGAAVAGGGLFAAAAVAATVGAGPTLVLAGVVGGLVVRDAGTHGVTLGREVGRRGETRRAELAHLGATVAVGVLAAGVAVALTGLLGRVPTLSGATLPVALGGAVLGVAAFVVALR
jgi:hypothetical protein